MAKFPFGKYRGKTYTWIVKNDRQYFCWLVNEATDVPDKVREIARKILQRTPKNVDAQDKVEKKDEQKKKRKKRSGYTIHCICDYCKLEQEIPSDNIDWKKGLLCMKCGWKCTRLPTKPKAPKQDNRVSCRCTNCLQRSKQTTAKLRDKILCKRCRVGFIEPI